MGKKIEIYWGKILIAGIGTVLTLLIADVLFVALYSHLMNPGEGFEFYQDFARETGAPFVTVYAPLVSYLFALWWSRRVGATVWLHAVLLALLLLVMDVVTVVVAGEGVFLWHPANLLAQAAKIVGILVGVVVTQRDA